MSEKLVNEGHKVIVTGRRESKLDDFIKKHGRDKADSEVLDITKLDKIPEVLRKLTERHPDIDCVVLNSGIQRRTGR